MDNNKNASLALIDVNELTQKELDTLQVQITERRIRELQENYDKMEKRQDEMEQRQSQYECSQTEIVKNVEKLKSDVNVLGSSIHSKRRKTFKKMASRRVYEILGDSSTAEFVLLSSYFFKGIYAQCADYMNVDNYCDISMEDYNANNSEYNKAKSYVQAWYPDRKYLNRVLDELIEKRDNGILKSERCRALSIVLKATNNGEDIGFCI